MMSETVATLYSLPEKDFKAQEERSYKEAFEYFDWNKSGYISLKDIINKVDSDSGTISQKEFNRILQEKAHEVDIEIHFKDTFRAFSKDEDGCIPADELKFVMTNLPGKVSHKDIEEMIRIVDKNGDGRISYSEFRSLQSASALQLVLDAILQVHSNIEKLAFGGGDVGRLPPDHPHGPRHEDEDRGEGNVHHEETWKTRGI